MTRYLIGRAAALLASLLTASLVVFFALELLPGDSATFMLGLNATPEAVATLRQDLGLDAPMLQRYGAWIVGMLTGSMGISYTYRVPVEELVAARIVVSLPLALYALALSVLIAIPVGIVAA